MVDMAVHVIHHVDPLMKNTSRKTIKRARKRKDHPAGCRVNDSELAHIDADIADMKRASGLTISRGAYAKHAILEYPALRRLLHSVRANVTLGQKESGVSLPSEEAIANIHLALRAYEESR